MVSVIIVALLPDRLMVGRLVLVQLIGVRVPVGQQKQKEPAPQGVGDFCFTDPQGREPRRLLRWAGYFLCNFLLFRCVYNSCIMQI